jgi:retron-type reverse transcriptase
MSKNVKSDINIMIEYIYVKVGLLEDGSSFGWQKSSGCHDAMKSIHSRFHAVDWIVEGDISNFFPTIKHSILIKIIEKTVKDPKFMRLLRRVLSTPMFDRVTKKTNKTLIGIPQGSILRPLLANLYLNELDKFILKLNEWVQTKNVEERRHSTKNVSSEYNRIRRRLNQKRKKLKTGRVKRINIRETVAEIRKLEIELVKVRRVNPDRKLLKLTYVRYGDDFLVGVTGNLKLAQLVKAKIKEFLNRELELELHNEKTLITNPRVTPVRFLGYLIKIGSPDWRQSRLKYVRNRDGRFCIKRTTSGTVFTYVDTKRVTDKLE